MKKANKNIRVKLCRNDITHTRCAKEVGITRFTFSKWLATPLDEQRRAKVLDAIDRIIKARNEEKRRKNK
jgi:hypothetical protein